ncbi:MAG: glycosyltransferase family 4 protein [Candidatus Hadarchaeales archaeon]
MRLLHINPFFYPYPGGTENYLYELCRRLSRKHSVSVLTSRLAGTKKNEVIEGIKVHRIKSIVLKKLPAFLPPPFSIPLGFRSELERICHEEDPDIIHLHNRFFLNFSSVAFWKKSLGKPLFLSLHNARPTGISSEVDAFGQLFDDAIGVRIMRASDRIIANSRWTLEVTVPEDYPRDRTEVIYNGVDTEKFRRIKTDLKDRFGCEFIITTVCRLVKQKGVENLVRALKDVEGDLRAIVVGKGPELGRLTELAKKENVERKVIFISTFISEKKLVEYYSASDLFVLPSLWEPFGIVLIEAMSCGTPVVATEVGGIPEVVGDAGVLVKPGNPDEIARAVNFILSDPRKRKTLSVRSRRRVEKHFDFNVISRKVEKSYENFLSGRR